MKPTYFKARYCVGMHVNSVYRFHSLIDGHVTNLEFVHVR